MAKWSDYKKTYQEQSNVWIKIPKDLSLYDNEELKNDNFNNTECFEFLFKQFDKNQLFDIITNQVENEKELVKKQISLFIDNIIDWKNIKVNDILKDDNLEELEYDKEAVDEFIANNFIIVPILIKEISNSLNKRKNKLIDQKKI